MPLEDFDKTFTGEKDLPTQLTGFPDGVDILRDGDYDLEVLSAVCKHNGGHDIFEVKMRVVNCLDDKGQPLLNNPYASKPVKHAWFMDDQESFLRVLKNLSLVGFDVKNWTVANNRPPSREFRDGNRWLKGMRVLGKKGHFDKKLEGGKKEERATFQFFGRVTKANGPDGSPGPFCVDGVPAVIGAEQIREPDPDDPFSAIPA